MMQSISVSVSVLYSRPHNQLIRIKHPYPIIIQIKQNIVQLYRTQRKKSKRKKMMMMMMRHYYGGAGNGGSWRYKVRAELRPTDQMKQNVVGIGMQEREMKNHFVLVHGACHGAWCWYKVGALMKDAGHKVTAIDLAASGIHPKKVEDVHSILDYSEPLLTFLDSLPSHDDGDDDDKVIVVAHSLGGYSLSIAMERFPHKISVGVFVIASMLGPDLTYKLVGQKYAELAADYMDTQLIFGNGPHKPPTAALVGPKYMETTSYRKSPRQEMAMEMLS
ncbi:Methyl jasmonate esterase 1 [Linum grandiflorum]